VRINKRAVQEFVVRAIYTGELSCSDTFHVMLADDATNPTAWIEMQIGLTFGEQDRALEQDTYCLVISGGAAHYGGIESYALQGNTLSLRLDTDAAKELGVDEEIVCQLQIPEGDVSNLQEGLRRIIGYGS
jgi:hypothetical protein